MRLSPPVPLLLGLLLLQGVLRPLKGDLGVYGGAGACRAGLGERTSLEAKSGTAARAAEDTAKEGHHLA